MTIPVDHLPQGAEKVTAGRNMFDAIAPRYDLVNRLMTFRMDVGWRRRTVSILGLPPRSLIADLACGTGDEECVAHWGVPLLPWRRVLAWRTVVSKRD